MPGKKSREFTTPPEPPSTYPLFGWLVVGSWYIVASLFVLASIGSTS